MSGFVGMQNPKTNIVYKIVSLIVVVVQIFDIVTALTFPEKLIYEYVNSIILTK